MIAADLTKAAACESDQRRRERVGRSRLRGHPMVGGRPTGSGLHERPMAGGAVFSEGRVPETGEYFAASRSVLVLPRSQVPHVALTLPRFVGASPGLLRVLVKGQRMLKIDLRPSQFVHRHRPIVTRNGRCDRR